MGMYTIPVAIIAIAVIASLVFGKDARPSKFFALIFIGAFCVALSFNDGWISFWTGFIALAVLGCGDEKSYHNYGDEAPHVVVGIILGAALIVDALVCHLLGWSWQVLAIIGSSIFSFLYVVNTLKK